jgi:hypothetical protein
MQRAFTSFAALLLVLAATTPSAWAKNSTVKITISGGALTGAIELNDQQILAISNIWSGEFLDRSKGTAKEPPRGLARYEVSFYVKATQSDARERYVS